MTLLSPVDTAAIRTLVEISAEPEQVRGAMGRFPAGIAAICAVVDGVRVGMVASSFSAGVSYAPPMVMFSVQNASSTWPVLRRASRIGVSILDATQADACMQLASRSRDRFEGLEVTETDGGSLLVGGATMWLDCEVVSTTPAGDHEIIVLQVHAMSVEHAGAPLVYHERRFHSLSALA
ncbi:flavin reductase family protein [Microbacterium excoecariae]|uniref:flavin reductase family protein n=1 Tax=Microbacterium excoecariae TaxID=2715210 RepID=UPI001408AE4E|nr:flavin reductase family protein [Microbacterium excoecariae]NHI17683.1 flavin reductase family protein [Microbacterium excoecariae]